MSFDIRRMSIAHWFPDTEKHRCGYCKNESGSISNGMWAETLTVEDYQNLIDRGWRRSGKYCYKPIMEETCCPQYTIKCDVVNISITKSQKKSAQKINFTKVNNTSDDIKIHRGIEKPVDFNKPHHSRLNEENTIQDAMESDKIYDSSEKICSVQKNASLKTTINNIGPDSSKPPCKKAKLLRLERKKEKLLKQISQNSKHKLRLKLVPTSEPGVTWERVKEVEFQLYKKYQMIVHNDPPTKLSMKGFIRFLVSSPLKPVNFTNGDGPGYGSFHQQYWIDDKLIAVGVIDILPKCISSVYFFYDPDYRNLTLGTYGALREVYFTRALQRKVPELSSYYMGFYIHSCPKMRYKGKLVPSFLLCPETYHWMPMEKCVEKLDANKYSRLEDDIDATDENVPTSREIGEIKVIYDYNLMYVRDYKRYHQEQNVFNEIGQLVGKKCARSIVFCMN
ncbi:hypothetical protein NQ318_020444 [Aromia moschata]|uniref:Arginyl-tRNA--protein transferase 1 n=1 Tax=Aromia moschata TaxID=1265417 RepID=A0AAV8YKC6_9CUCU|nr:hypothetical protein NQ318_020444 [Aromia moschata]